MDETIKNILEAAILAPSGENCQPWRFEFGESNIIQLFNLPKRDQSLYSWGQRASFVALGALLENLLIAAEHFCLEAKISSFPDKNNEQHVADITLVKSDKKPKTDLYEPLLKRCTNRKPYKKAELSVTEKESLLSAVGSATEGVEIRLTGEREKIEIAGEVGALNEKIMLSNRSLHNFFFEHVNWNKKEDDDKKIGFYIKTLELPPPAEIFFQIFSNWNRVEFLRKIGFNPAKVVAKANQKIYASSAAIGILTINDLRPESFLLLGRKFEKVWITATKLGLDLQPLTGVLFMRLRLLHNDRKAFTNPQAEAIFEAYNKLVRIFNVPEGKHISIMFRVGRGKPPTAQSSRFPLGKVVG